MYSTKNFPLIPISLENKIFWVQFNLSDGGSLKLNDEYLKTIKKNYLSKIRNNNGDEQQIYRLDQLKLDKHELKDVVLSTYVNKEKPLEPQEIPLSSIERQGVIGRRLFQKNYLVIDLPHQKILHTNSSLNLAKHGYNHHLMSLPFEISPYGFVISIETNLGKHRFFLSMLDKKNLFGFNLYPNYSMEKNTIFYSQLKYKHNKLDSISFLCDTVPSTYGIDGCLGLSFFKEHIVIFDFANKMLYIN
jgi:hypothetical protein